MKKINVDVTKVLSIAGVGLSLVGSLLANAAADKKNEKLIAKLVEDGLANKK